MKQWRIKLYDTKPWVVTGTLSVEGMGDHVVATVLDIRNLPVAVFLDPESIVALDDA
jgi:hypothetical protein